MSCYAVIDLDGYCTAMFRIKGHALHYVKHSGVSELRVVDVREMTEEETLNVERFINYATNCTFPGR